MGCHDHSAHWRKLSRRPGCLNNTLSNRVVVQQGGLAALGNINAIHVPAQQEERDAAQSLEGVSAVVACRKHLETQPQSWTRSALASVSQQSIAA